MNTIILRHSERRLTKEEFKKFKKGDLIYGDNSDAEELKRWSIADEAQAVDELKKYHCSYKTDGCLHNIEEYALEYCNCDEDGEFLTGSDYDLAPEI